MLANELDPHSILQGLGITDVTSATSVHGGSDTAIWRIEHAGEVYALRVFQEGQQDDCEREKLVMQAARSAGLPVPLVHASGNWHDHPALLLSRLSGRTIADDLRAHPWRAWRLGILFGHMQAAIHVLPAPDILCQDPDVWIKWLGPGEQPLQQYLRSLNHRADRLLHLDYHPLNVLTDGKNITGVLDWRNARAGNPRADVARTVSILRVDAASMLRLPERLILKIFELGWRYGYEQKSDSLGAMAPFYAWAGVVMERDLAQKREPDDLARIHAWATRWKERAGVGQPDG
jgi:aminoglycoside phosphotransferase (APT) family kinase protein